MEQQVQAQAKGFFAKLFDFSFRDFITPTIISILYGIFLVLAGLGAIAFIVNGFRMGVGYGIIFLIVSPLVFLLIAIIYRILLEAMIALIRIAQNTTDLLRK